MYVTQHAKARIRDRLDRPDAHRAVALLERASGDIGTVAYMLANVAPKVADDGSNGDILIAVAVDGSVETVYFRRSTHDMSAAFFGADRVVDWRHE